MKSWTWPIILVATIAIVVGLEEWRISKLEGRISELAARQTPEPAARGGTRNMTGHAPAAVKPTRSDRPPAAPATPAGDDPPASVAATGDEDSFPKTLRKMVDNPATKAMMNQGIKAMAGVWFEGLIEDLDLNKEERDYFLSLVGGGFAAQQQAGMRLMDVKDADERKAIMAEIEAAKAADKLAIKEFLNDDDDYKAYEDYMDRLPERQQLDGLRAVMNQAQQPLSPEQEEQVMEAAYQARKNRTDSIDWEGSGAMEAMASGDASALFEKDWDKNSKRTLEEVSKVLEGEQLAAFASYQEQIKEAQLMGIKMAERMFGGNKDGEQPAPAPAPPSTPDPGPAPVPPPPPVPES